MKLADPAVNCGSDRLPATLCPDKAASAAWFKLAGALPARSVIVLPCSVRRFAATEMPSASRSAGFTGHEKVSVVVPEPAS